MASPRTLRKELAKAGFLNDTASSYDLRAPKETNNDHRDDSQHPSFNNFKLPYEVIVRMRYHDKCKKYEKQFQHELKMHELMQPTAYEAARFNRHLGITTLWPPLHNAREITYTRNKYFSLTPKQQKHFYQLMNETPN